MRFESVIGQRAVINRLTQAVDDGRIAHAQLFYGLEGSQKLPIAIAYAQYVNCNDRQHYTPEVKGLRADSCGHCPSCIKMSMLQHPDLHFFFPNNKSAISKKECSLDYYEPWRQMIKEHHGDFSLLQWYAQMDIGNKQGYINKNDVDAILNILAYTNVEAPYKVMVIWLPEKFYHAVSTRLLKALEEPSSSTLFLMVSEDTNTIPATILSRLQMTRLPKIDPESLGAFLVDQQATPEMAKDLAKQANGNLRLAQDLLAQAEQQAELHRLFVEWMRYAFQRKLAELYTFANQNASLGRESLKALLNYGLDLFRNCVLYNYGNPKSIHLNDQAMAWLEKFAPFIHHENLCGFVDSFDEAINHIERNVNTKIVLMDLSIRLTILINQKHS